MLMPTKTTGLFEVYHKKILQEEDILANLKQNLDLSMEDHREREEIAIQDAEKEIVGIKSDVGLVASSGMSVYEENDAPLMQHTTIEKLEREKRSVADDEMSSDGGGADKDKLVGMQDENDVIMIVKEEEEEEVGLSRGRGGKRRQSVKSRDGTGDDIVTYKQHWYMFRFVE